MKQEILNKLFNNEELTAQELVYVSTALNKTEVDDVIPYDHKNENTLTACGLDEKYVKGNHEELRTMFDNLKMTSKSEIVEKIEALVVKDPKFLRVVLLHFVKNSVEQMQDMDVLPDEIKDIKKIIEDRLGGKGKIGFKIIRGGEKESREDAEDKIDKHFEMLKFLMEMREKLNKKDDEKDSEK